MGKSKAYSFSDAKSDLYDRLLETCDDVERKGVTMPYTSLNGHMFSFLDKSGSLGLRLPEKERENFLRKYQASLFEAHGSVLKEYVLVPEKLFENTKELKTYFDISVEYIKSLKPKPPTKKRKTSN